MSHPTVDVIDSVVHVTPDGRWFETNHDASVDRLIHEMDCAGVTRSVVVPLAGHIANEYVEEVCTAHPDRLIPGVSTNPAASPTPTEAATAVRDLIAASRCRVLKLHPRLHGYDPLDDRCTAVLEEVSMRADRVAVWVDTFLYVRSVILRKPPIDTLHELVVRFPAVTFVLLHGAGPAILQLADAVRDCPNVFVDASYTACKYRTSSVALDLRYLIANFDRRLVFGSDFPEFSLPDAFATVRAIADGLPAEKIENVLGRNLAALLA